MGLQEKRALAQLRDETVPKYQAELQKITGTPVVYVVDFGSFADNLAAIGNLEPKCLKVLNEIFGKITKDTIGKEAVAESIKEIHLKHGEIATMAEFTLKKGVLSMPWDWSGWPGSFFPSSVQERIESLL